jgi:hypothetical protein
VVHATKKRDPEGPDEQEAAKPRKKKWGED